MLRAVISHIHGNLLALEAVIADIGTRGVDATVNLGDSVAGPLWPSETAECLVASAFPTVRGNHDRWMLDGETDSLPQADRFARAARRRCRRYGWCDQGSGINAGRGIGPASSRCRIYSAPAPSGYRTFL